MTELVIQPTATAEFQSLVQEGEHACHYQLGEELESYLVFLLIRFMNRPDIANSVLATEWLNALGKYEALQTVGDKCLLFSGFYPKQAERKQVKVKYFVDLGQSAYSALALKRNVNLSLLFGSLCKEFVKLMDVLQAIREMSGEKLLTPLEAMELWSDTGSQRAFSALKQQFSATPIVSEEDSIIH